MNTRANQLAPSVRAIVSLMLCAEVLVLGVVTALPFQVDFRPADVPMLLIMLLVFGTLPFVTQRGLPWRGSVDDERITQTSLFGVWARRPPKKIDLVELDSVELEWLFEACEERLRKGARFVGPWNELRWLWASSDAFVSMVSKAIENRRP